MNTHIHSHQLYILDLFVLRRPVQDMDTRASKRQKTQREVSTSASASVVPNAPAAPRLFPNESSAAATDEDRKRWKGWCEIESEPVRY